MLTDVPNDKALASRRAVDNPWKLNTAECRVMRALLVNGCAKSAGVACGLSCSSIENTLYRARLKIERLEGRRSTRGLKLWAMWMGFTGGKP